MALNKLLFIFAFVSTVSCASEKTWCRFALVLVESSQSNEKDGKFGYKNGTIPQNLSHYDQGSQSLFLGYQFQLVAKEDYDKNSDKPLFLATLASNGNVSINFSDIPCLSISQKQLKNYVLKTSLFPFPCTEKNENDQYLFFQVSDRGIGRSFLLYPPPPRFYVKIPGNKEHDQSAVTNDINKSSLQSIPVEVKRTQSGTTITLFSFSLPSYLLGFVTGGALIAIIWLLQKHKN